MNYVQRASEAITFYGRERTIHKQVRSSRSTIYGGQAIKAQIGFLARPTIDYDIYARRPSTQARLLETNLDKQSGADAYYTAPSRFHQGTYKVYYKGADRKKGTNDDVGVADFTQYKKVPARRVQGLRYASLNSIAQDKKKALNDPRYKFRWEKDRDDLQRIQAFKQLSGGRRRSRMVREYY